MNFDYSQFSLKELLDWNGYLILDYKDFSEDHDYTNSIKMLATYKREIDYSIYFKEEVLVPTRKARLIIFIDKDLKFYILKKDFLILNKDNLKKEILQYLKDDYYYILYWSSLGFNNDILNKYIDVFIENEVLGDK